MHPTIGRIVHYTVQHDPNTVKTFAAIITSIDAELVVSLTIFPDSTTPYCGRGIPFADVPTVGCWSWPPRA